MMNEQVCETLRVSAHHDEGTAKRPYNIESGRCAEDQHGICPSLFQTGDPVPL